MCIIYSAVLAIFSQDYSACVEFITKYDQQKYLFEFEWIPIHLRAK